MFDHSQRLSNIMNDLHQLRSTVKLSSAVRFEIDLTIERLNKEIDWCIKNIKMGS